MEKEASPKVTADLNTRFLCNDPEKPLSWAEFEALWKFYYDLDCKLSHLGRDFYLAHMEVQRRLTKLQFIKGQMKERERKSGKKG